MLSTAGIITRGIPDSSAQAANGNPEAADSTGEQILIDTRGKRHLLDDDAHEEILPETDYSQVSLADLRKIYSKRLKRPTAKMPGRYMKCTGNTKPNWLPKKKRLYKNLSRKACADDFEYKPEPGTPAS